MTMASLSIQRLSTVLRGAQRQIKLQSTRNYTVTPAKPAWIPRQQYSKPTVTAAAPVATVSTGTGSPVIPASSSEPVNTASEIPPPNEIGSGNESGETPTDWSKSYFGLSTHAFSKDIAEVLMAPIDPLDIEMKPGEYPLYQPQTFHV